MRLIAADQTTRYTGSFDSICNVSEQVRMGTSAKKKQFQYNDVKLHCPHLS